MSKKHFFKCRKCPLEYERQIPFCSCGGLLERIGKCGFCFKPMTLSEFDNEHRYRHNECLLEGWHEN